MVGRLLLGAALPQGGEVAPVGEVVGRGLLEPHRLHQPLHAQPVEAQVHPRGAEQGLLVLAEAQDDVNAVDAAPRCGPPTLPDFVEVAGGEAAVVHHAHGVQ